jgi:hypothetical protein
MKPIFILIDLTAKYVRAVTEEPTIASSPYPAAETWS